jgi:hypothetical protein
MIEPANGGSAVQVDLEYELPGEILGSLFGMLTGNRLEQEFKKTYGNLRRLAEAESGSLVGPSGDGGSTSGRSASDDRVRVAGGSQRRAAPSRAADPPTDGDADRPDDDGAAAPFAAEPVAASVT